MKIVFVVGGSYKAFYLNHLKKFKKLDFLVFQEGILYDYDYYNELCGDRTVTQEMMELSKRLGCKIVARIKTNFLGGIETKWLYCDGKKLVLSNLHYLKLFYNTKTIFFADKQLLNKPKNLTIILTENRLKLKNRAKFCPSNLLICDKRGVELKKNGKIARKFIKICYFSLKI